MKKIMKICLLNIVTNTSLKMELFTKGNGKVQLDMAMVSKCGLMGQGMKESGNLIKLMERENFGTSMVMSLTVNGEMTKLMDTEYILMSMVLNMKDTGKMIFNMGMVLKHGLTGHNMKAIIKRVRNMERALILGVTVPNM